MTFKEHVLPGSKISHLFIEEAENERMHLMTALEMKKPGIIFRGAILLAQGNSFSEKTIIALTSPSAIVTITNSSM